MREAINEGRLAAGTALPSSRSLSQDLGVARGTVVEAYTQLVAEGLLVTLPGAGTAVAATLSPALPSENRDEDVPRISLLPGLLDLEATYPRRLWLNAVRDVLHTAPDASFDYGDPRGRSELREALASYLGRARGVVTTPDRIVICSGFSHGLTLVATSLRAAGVRTVAMEDPCLPFHRDIVRRQGLGVVPVGLDPGGATVDGLDRLDAPAVVLTPAHQYPTGVTLTPERRTALVDWARNRDALIVEDDYDGEFRYDRQHVGAMQGLDPTHVIYGGTVSKTLAPGMRLGWLVLPARLVEPVVEVHRNSFAFPPALDQLALASLLRSGRFDRHLRFLRALYHARRDQLATAVTGAMPSLRTAGTAAGLHFLLELPEAGPTEDDIRVAALRHGVALACLGSHWHEPGHHVQGVVVGYSRPPAHAFAQAVDALIAVVLDADRAASADTFDDRACFNESSM